MQTTSTSGLIKATLSSLLIAGVVLITCILPAEYNIDPTGIGKKLGLTVLSQPSAQVNNENIATVKSDEFEVIEVTVPAKRGIEFKFAMAKYDKLEYEWLTDGAPLYFDLHGEPQGDTTGYFESYAIATSDEMKGGFTAPFAGSHGWYWKNTTADDVAVQLMVKGEYQVIGLKK